MNYYSHHIGDYIKDTAHLSFVEDSAYRKLLDKYYADEKPIPNDLPALLRLVRARSKEEKEAVSIVLEEFFTSTDAGWAHKRCDAEIAIFQEKSAKAASAAHKRWGHSGNADDMRTHSERTAKAMPPQYPISNTQSPISNNHDPVLNTIPHQQAGAPATFELVIPDQSPAKVKTAKPLDPDEQQGCKDAWAAYSQAYQNRYAVAPVRNAAVNAKVKQLVKRIGKDEAPGVCRFYVDSVNDAFVVKKMHDMGLLLQGCEGYRTQWITGKAVTGESAKRVEKTQDFSDKMDEISAMIDQQQRAAQ